MKKLVVLTGAGISAESGLKTFRDSDGLWEGYNIEDVATPQAFSRDPALVLEFYNFRRKNVADAEPNEAHRILASLEEHFDVHIITQNIDDLHQRAGSTKVLHLHGEIFKMRSSRNQDMVYEIRGDISIGDKAPDGSQLRPYIVWFGEAVPMIEKAAEITATADIFAVVGTSLMVYPAAGLVHYKPSHVPCYLVDKHLPDVSHIQNLIAIEQPATSGMGEMKAQLMQLL
jgi:NAD-dependent deacetylase